MQIPEDKKVQISISTLFTIYTAGFNHGANEGPLPAHGVYEAFERLLKDESPMLDNVNYSISDKITYL
jgi:hypothetical protein